VIISILGSLSVFRKDKNKLANNASEQSQQHCEHMNNKHIRAIQRESRAQPSRFARLTLAPRPECELKEDLKRRTDQAPGRNRDNKM
jgi:hypothetical protein